MRVAMYYNNHDIRLEEMPIPRIGSGEILVKVVASGICGSDVMEWYRIKNFVSHHIPCNTCYYCLRGHHTACETLHTTNYDPGGFAEYIRVPGLNVDRGVFILPDELSFDDGVFIEPLACVIRGQRVANLQPGQSVLILGSGISGMLHLLLAKALGAGKIITTDVNEYRLQMARSLGADAAIEAREDISAQLLKINNNRLADLVIVCTGAPSAFNQSLKLVDRGGTILCFATTEPGIELSVPLNEFWRNEIKLMPSYGNSPLDAIEAIELIRAGRVPVKKMITHRLSLGEAGLGFQLVDGGKESMKVIIEPHR